MERCVNCGRFVGENAIELQDKSFATPDDPDGWTGTFVCASGVGCQTSDAIRKHLDRWAEPIGYRY